MKKRSCKYLEEFASMPPLYHTLPGQEYSHEKSEVFQWMIKNEKLFWSVLNNAMSNAKSHGLIKYDSETGKWCGTECEQK